MSQRNASVALAVSWATERRCAVRREERPADAPGPLRLPLCRPCVGGFATTAACPETARPTATHNRTTTTSEAETPTAMRVAEFVALSTNDAGSRKQRGARTRTAETTNENRAETGRGKTSVAVSSVWLARNKARSNTSRCCCCCCCCCCCRRRHRSLSRGESVKRRPARSSVPHESVDIASRPSPSQAGKAGRHTERTAEHIDRAMRLRE
ncbi:hypothetical protein BC831DRAFT_218046 [Entophlyctis helioformis]|nr:hypothetical protein BC831DRAFT_218046 [Entophlyctis helioformis]